MTDTVTRSFDSFGVAVDVVVPARHAEAAFAVLPPGHHDRSSESAPELVVTLTARGDRLEVAIDGAPAATSPDLDVALNAFDAQMRLHIAERAPDHIFVHAGCVAVDGRALMLPGRSFAGKSTLVAELVRQGAEYMSDEYAVLDASGRARPYPRAISLRRLGRHLADEIAASELGATAADVPIDVGAVALLTYVHGTPPSIDAITSGEASLKLLEHTVPVRSRPGPSLAACGAAVRGAICLQGRRGDAVGAARHLLDTLAAGERPSVPRQAS